MESRELAVTSVASKPASRNPWPPFMTSTLQQEASRKLGLGARACMSAAQRLYEAGYITYMRTDGIDMAPEAVMAARDAIKARFGADYVPKSPRMYKNKAKNAQEAHECIRPTDMMLSPDRLNVEPEQRKLYELIWKRTLASQMEAARMERTTVETARPTGRLRATGAGDAVRRLPAGLRPGHRRRRGRGQRPPARDRAGRARRQARRDAGTAFHPAAAALYRGHAGQAHGRAGDRPPSTYASIVTTIQDREYVRKDKNRLIPEDKGRLVTAFLVKYFPRYVSYDFTADLEGELDDISSGSREYREVLRRFWRDFAAALADTSELRISEVLTAIDEALARIFTRRAPMAAIRGNARCAGPGG